jgi:hypothetical protein
MILKKRVREHRMKKLTAAAIIYIGLLTAGCSSSIDNVPSTGATDPTSGNLNPAPGSSNPAASAPTAALFRVSLGIFPFPNDFYFAGSTDGTLNLPANPLVPNTAGLNALDGYSLTAPWRVRFGSAINPATLNASTVRVVEVTLSATNVPTPVRPLTLGTDFTVGLAADADAGNSIVEIRPTRPLTRSGTGATPSNPLGNTYAYFVYLTNGIATASGSPVTADADYAAFRAAAPTCSTVPASATAPCQLIGAHLAVGQGVLGLNPATVVVSFSFRTQDTRATMDAVAATIYASPAPPIAVAPTAIPLNTFNPALPPIANVRLGTVTVPYYSPIPSGPNDASVLARFWTAAAAPAAPLTDAAAERNLTRFNRVPAKIADRPIPLLVSVPSVAVKPLAGWPVVVFQHGLGGDRSQALAIAATFANAGWAVASVDAPLHGITSPSSPFYQAANEQTFNLDLVNNATGAAVPDGVIDPSSTHFINLSNPRASRDSLRQGITNLLALTRALPNLDLDGDTATVDIDGTRIAFVGISLGGILGTGYAATLPNPTTLVRTAVLSVPGGGIAELLRTSPTFAPRINAGLAPQGLTPGTSLYSQFFRDVQTIADAGDPVNYIASAVSQRNVYLSQVVGSATSLPDQVVPNSATQRMLAAAGSTALPQVFPGAPRVGSGYVNFVAGSHGSLLTPGTTATDLAAFTEMQTQAAVFTATGGTINIVNAAVVQGP